MLLNLVRKCSVIHIAGKEFKIRYTLNALLYLEMQYKPIGEILRIEAEKWSITDCIELIRAGLCSLPENWRAVNDREWDRVLPTAVELGEVIAPADLPLLRYELLEAIADSFKNGGGGESGEEHQYYTGYGHLRAFYCDILGRTDYEFWDSTQKEIENRIDWYLEVKGQKEKPIIVKKYDD